MASGELTSSSSLRLASSGEFSGSSSLRLSSQRPERSQHSEKLNPLNLSATIEKKKKISEAFQSINQLNFDSVGLVGREEETLTITKCLDRLLSDQTKELLLVSGCSGSGKSTLVTSACENHALLKKGQGVLVGAKYDTKFRDSQPYSAISDACNKLCKAWLEKYSGSNGDAEISRIGQQVLKAIDESQLDLLQRIIPLLGNLSRPSKEGAEANENSFAGVDMQSSAGLLNLAFRRLIPILSASLGVPVIFLDDLQWVDGPSLELIESMLQDKLISSVMVIGCYRSEEVDATHVLSKAIRSLKERLEVEADFSITEISVGNFSLNAVQSYIQDLLSVSEPEKVAGLSSICHRRTLGNIFFLKVFLKSLYDSSSLEFNTNIFQWWWDESVLEIETAATDNLSDLLISKMRDLRPEVLMILKIASCLGNTFDYSTILLLWEHIGKPHFVSESEDVDLAHLLQVAVNEMFFEAVGDSSFRFVHDKVQESASLLLPTDDYRTFQSQVGSYLREELDEATLDRMIFVVVDLLNFGSDKSYEIALLNLKAAEQSMMLSAIVSAAHYVKYGLGNLEGASMWEDYYQVALQLHSIGAEAESYIGNNEQSEWYCSEICKQSSPLIDKMRAYKVMIDRLHVSLKKEESLGLCLDLLEQFGYRFPTNRILCKIKANISLRETKRHHLPTIEDIERMPYVSDPKTREIIRLFMSSGPEANGSGRPSLYVLLCCQGIRLTKKYGFTEHTSSMFLSFANVLMHRYGDWSTAVKLAEASFKIQDRISSNHSLTSTLFKANMAVLGWVRPLKSVVSGFVEGYRVGMLSGNLDGAGLSIMAATAAQLFSGTSLKLVDDDAKTYINQMQQLRQNNTVSQLRCIGQVVHDLTGNESSTSQGIDLFDRDNAIPNPLIKTLAKQWICYECAYLGEYEKGAEVALKEGDSTYKMALGFAFFGFHRFPRALCLYAAARIRKDSKMLKAAKKTRKALELHAQKGGTNFLHQLLILNGEEAVSQGNRSKAEKTYREAIFTAARGGFLQDAGLANERYAEYLISVDGISSDAKHQYSEAIRYYTEWGASRKVEMLRERQGGSE